MHCIDNVMAEICPIKSHFAAIGNARDLCTYLLSELLPAPPEIFAQAATIGAYCVEKAKQHIEGCGGAAQIAGLMVCKEKTANRNSRGVYLAGDDELTLMHVKAVQKVDKLGAEQVEKLRNALSKELARFNARESKLMRDLVSGA